MTVRDLKRDPIDGHEIGPARCLGALAIAVALIDASPDGELAVVVVMVVVAAWWTAQNNWMVGIVGERVELGVGF